MKWTSAIAALLLVALIFLISLESNLAVKALVGRGVLTIAFDDGTQSQYDYAFPLLQQYGIHATFYAISSEISDFSGNNGFMSIAELQTLQNSGSEIGSHSVTHTDFTSLTDSQIVAECVNSKQLLQAYGLTANNFAYPYGSTSDHANSIVTQFYRSARSAYIGPFFMPLPTSQVILTAYPAETGDPRTVSQLDALHAAESILDQVVSSNSYGIIFFHNVIPGDTSDSCEISQEYFQDFLQYVVESGVQTLTVNQALDIGGSPLSVSISPSSMNLIVGHSQLFSSTVTGGVSPYSYQWNLNGTAVSSAHSSTWNFTPSSAGTYKINLNVIDSDTVDVRSNTATVVVKPPLTVNVSPASWTMNAGQTERFSAIPNGGSGTYSFYQWYVDGVVQSGEIASKFSFAPVSSGSYSITATVTDSLGVTSLQSSAATVTVNSASAANLVVSGFPSPTAAGESHTFMVTAYDVYSNVATGYEGTVAITSSDIQAVLPASAGLTDGIGYFSITLETAGSQSITATDTETSSITGSQTVITVNPGVATHLATLSGTSQVAGTAFSVTITAKDTYGNTATGYAGTVHFSSSDSGAGVNLPGNYAFQVWDKGVRTFSVTLITAGTESITATDTVASSITGSQSGITVTHATAVANVVISSAGSSVTAGASKTYSAIASDANGNTWDVTSSTIWSITSGSGGSWKSNVYTSATAGSWTVTGNYASTVYTTVLSVNPAGLDHFAFNAIATQTAGSAFNITVTVVDAYGNTVTSYTGTPSLSYSAGTISPGTMNAFTGGVGSSSVMLTAADSSATIIAIDGTHTGTSNSFTVNPTITASAGVNGAISPTGIVAVDYDGNQSFTIMANTGYYIVDVSVNGNSIGAVNSYTFRNIQAQCTISATFAPTPTPTPTATAKPTANPKPTAAPTPTPKSTTTSTPTPSQTPTNTPSPPPKQTQSSIPQEAIYGTAFAAGIVAIGGTMFVLRKNIPEIKTGKQPVTKSFRRILRRFLRVVDKF